MATSPDLCNSFFIICCDPAFILCYFCNMLSGIVQEIACPEALHTSGCFDSHISMIYLAGCVLFTSRWSSHSLLLCGGKGKSDGFTRGSQRFRSETLERRCFITCFYKMLAMKTYNHSVMSFRHLCRLWTSVWPLLQLFCLSLLNIDLFWGGSYEPKWHGRAFLAYCLPLWAGLYLMCFIYVWFWIV